MPLVTPITREELYQKRKKLHLSQTFLADLLALSRVTICRFENGAPIPCSTAIYITLALAHIEQHGTRPPAAKSNT